HGEEPGGPGAEEQRRHGHERVRGVQVAADEEPGDPGAEVAAAEAPLVEVVQVGRAAPARGDEAHRAHAEEQDDEDDDLGGVALHRAHPRRFVIWYTSVVVPTPRMMNASCSQ